MKGTPLVLYSADQIVDLLGGKRSNLPTWLEWRGNEIWWAKKFSDDDNLTDAERSAVRTHPNGNPTTEPLLRERFTEAEFIAFEDCAHVFRSLYLTGQVTITISTTDLTRHRAVHKWTALKADVAEPIRQFHPKAYALLESLLGMPLGPRRRVTAASQQEDALLDTLRGLGYDPLALPVTPGKRGAKAACWEKLKSARQLFPSQHRFNAAWERLKTEPARIRDANPWPQGRGTP